MRNLAIARRYAKALLLIAKEDGQTETYRGELQAVTDMFLQQKELDQSVNNPLHDLEARRKVLAIVMEKLNLSPTLSSFLMLLFDKRRFGFLDSINDNYQRMADEVKGVARASLVAATELPAETIEKIRTTLSSKTGKDIILEVEQDPGLIGGIVTRIGDLVLDGSIRTQLLNMRETLKRGESV